MEPHEIRRIRRQLSRGMSCLEGVVQEIGKQKSYNDLHHARQEVQRALRSCKRALEGLDASEEDVGD